MPTTPATLTAQLHQCIIIEDGELISATLYPTRKARLAETVAALVERYPGVDVDEVNGVLFRPWTCGSDTVRTPFNLDDPNDFLLDDALGEIAGLYKAVSVDIHILPQDVVLSLSMKET